jgi:hypothetical protein
MLSKQVYAYDDYEQWYVDPQNPEVQNMIRQFCLFPLESNLMYNARSLYIALSRRLTYDHTFVHAWQTIPEMLRRNKGVCCDFARLYYSLLRGIGWPEHCIEIVYAPVYGLFGNPLGVSHAWVEVKTPSPFGTPLALFANESIASLEGQQLEMGFNDTYVSLPAITPERIQTIRASGWVNRAGWVPIDPTPAVCYNEIPIIGSLAAPILWSAYLAFGYGVFPFNGYLIHYSEIQPYYGPWSSSPQGEKPRRENLPWGNLSVTVNPHESFNVSYLHDIELNQITLGMGIGINSNSSTNVEIRNPENQIIDSASGVTSYSENIYWGSSAPPFPKNLGIYWFIVYNPQTYPARVTFSLSSGAILTWLGGDDAINQTLYNNYSIPYINTYNVSGCFKNTFESYEDVYVKGTGYPVSTQMTIYVIPDGENATPSNAKSVAHETTDVNGTLALSLLWPHPVNVGSYDIWVDANENNVYDDGDVLNDEAVGVFAFEVVSPARPPIISILSPENKTYAINNSITLTFTVSESTFWTGYSLDKQANVSIAGNTTLPILSDGWHNVIVYAKDNLGNMGVSNTVYFAVDTIAPSITNITQIPLSNVLPEDEVKINATVTDHVSGTEQVILDYICINSSGTWTQTANMTKLEGNIWNATIPAFPSGTNITYTISAQDKAGNTITSEQLGYVLSYYVVPEVQGDINSDGTVDIYDAILLANAYGSGPGSPNWNAAADINGDNVIDIYDALILAGNYGKTA